MAENKICQSELNNEQLNEVNGGKPIPFESLPEELRKTRQVIVDAMRSGMSIEELSKKLQGLT